MPSDRPMGVKSPEDGPRQDAIVRKLRRMSYRELVAWSDEQLRRAPASELYQLATAALEQEKRGSG